MRLFLIVILFVLFFLIGLFVYCYYGERVRVIKDLTNICGILSRDISFKKNTINSILKDSYKSMSFSTKCIIKNHDFAKKILTQEKSEFVINFFESLGKGDVAYEVEKLDYYKKEFNDMYALSKEDLQKKGVLYFKLIIGVGLIICIILL